MMVFEGIEFSDRYGGRTPSWLRACLRCEAMGCYPQPPAGADRYEGITVVEDWTFVACERCHGTTHVSWFVTAARIPRWLVNGGWFIWRQYRQPFNTNVSRLANARMAFKIAFLIDLGLWRP